MRVLDHEIKTHCIEKNILGKTPREIQRKEDD